MRKIYVIYHARCLDGMTSAAIAYQKFGNQATYLPGVHGALPFDELVDADIYMVDYSLKEPALLELLEKGNRVTIIDHHEAPISQIAHVPIHELVFDKEESGASLAWNFFFPELEMPHMVKLIKDNDLWKFRYPETKGFISWLEQFPLDIVDFNKKLSMTDEEYQKAYEIGNPLYRYKMNLVADIVEQARPCVIKGKAGWAVNGPYPLASVIGEELSKLKGTYSMIWSERADRVVQVSFRATEGVVARELAQALGGNGHEKAAGCELTQQAFHKLMAASDRALENPGPGL